VLLLLLTTFINAAPVAETADEARWHRIVGLLEYLEGDYAGALNSGDKNELAEQQGFADEVVKQFAQSSQVGSDFLARAQTLQKDIQNAAPSNTVVPQCHSLVSDLVQKTGLLRAPTHTPNLEDGKRLYVANCAVCHGEDGRAQTPVAQALNPKPANFRDEKRIESLTPYKAFNTTTFGIIGTPMPGFPQLSLSERWAVAFYVFGFEDAPCSENNPASLQELASSTNTQLALKYGAPLVPCMRRNLAPKQSSVAIAVTLLEQAQTAYAQGDSNKARLLTVDAYLNGIEPIEPALRAKDSALVSRIENAFTQTRLAAQNENERGEFKKQSDALLVLLRSLTDTTSSADFWSVFFTALLIVLREGFEAVVVLGALLAAMKKMQAMTQVRVVHAGWISALIAGALAFIFGQKLLAGANREWLEAVVALLAVGMLLYAALWLNARSHISQSMGHLREVTGAAIGSGSTLSLFLIAFSSAGRESFETALFLQGLHSTEHNGAIYGALAGLCGLLGFVLLIRSVGFKLPMKTMFKLSTVLLLVTAVMLLGKGLHGLQELGVLPLAPIAFFSIAFLGIFADAMTLVPQFALAVACIAGAKYFKHV
jgi:high-affinity iron transporter